MTKPGLGTPSRPLRVAVIGSGPSGFYAVEALFKVGDLVVRCDVFDRLPTPYGLVRGGVAPDHQKIKSVTRIYDKIAAHPGFRFLGNVKLGRDLQVEDLAAHYDQIVYAVGNESARELGIPGEDLEGVCSATEFVFWYNGHPDYRECEFDLSRTRRVAVVGNGNVAMDVCRVLIQDPERLAETDIADHALDVLRNSAVREVVLLGRRGPAQAAFSPKEIKEVAELEGVDLEIDPESVELDDVTKAWLAGGDAPKSAEKNLAFLAEVAARGPGSNERKVHSRFLVSPVELVGEGGRLTRVRLQRNEIFAARDGTPRPRGLDDTFDEEVQMLFTAIGYRGIPIPGVPFDAEWGLIPNDEGRVLTARGGSIVPGQYVVGWAKRGPSGLIGTNSPDSKATVEKMVEDLRGQTADPLPEDEAERILTLLRGRGVDVVSFADWQRLDAFEQERGKALGRVRQKLVEIDAMLGAIRG
ncbi:MAG: FAD-dependent oxidoreductase [Planctomycetes bacterium]|nr:FAD-dependent oxidoreductase [Planctomycetota bacterium]